MLVVTRIDRLARSMKDLQDIVHELKAKGVALKATDQPIDTGSAAGKAFLDMLGVFAEFETSLRRERQLEGIRAAKTRGVYKGRKPSIDAAEVRRLREVEKLGPSAIARKLGIGRASVYRLLDGGRSAGESRLMKPDPTWVFRSRLSRSECRGFTDNFSQHYALSLEASPIDGHIRVHSSSASK